MARYDDLNTNMIAYGTVLSIVVLVIVLQGTQALTYSMVHYEDVRKDSKKSDAAAKVKSDQIATLDGYKRVAVADEKSDTPGATKSVLRIPIEEAQKLIGYVVFSNTIHYVRNSAVCCAILLHLWKCSGRRQDSGAIGRGWYR